MCGIAGSLAFDGRPADGAVLRSMTSALRHRGPDGSGIHREGPLGLAHRRLSILDLEGGGQPMSTRDSRAWIVFNGEIYNYVELRAGLLDRGHPFETASDTEVILHLYEERGLACVEDLRGMFAFALWDPDRMRLVLARDRVGIKPLYYHAHAGGLVFASEIKALFRHPDVPRVVDPAALGEFLTYQYIPGPRTAFRGIHALPPAHVLVAERGTIGTQRYWSLPGEVEERSPEAWREDLVGTLDEAVRIHMRSDVPVGALLSGGIDSSLVVAAAAASSNGPLRTFSVGFGDASFSELPYARQVAEMYGTRHTECILEPQSTDALPSIIAQFDQPFGDPSAVPTSAIARVAAAHVKVCLSGDGGDEGFAGYDAYRLAARLKPVDAVPIALRRLLLGGVERRVPEWVRGKGLLRFLSSAPADRYAELMSGVDSGVREWLLDPRFREAAGPAHPYDRIRALHRRQGAMDEVARLQRIDMETYLPDDILVKSDITSMMHSLELRVPLLDHKVLELAFRMPTSLKRRGATGKTILRSAFADRLPRSVRGRGKRGFGLPLAAWFRGDLFGLARDVFSDRRTRQRGILDPSGLDRLLASHLRGHRDLSNEIWLALVLEIWFRERVDGVAASLADQPLPRQPI